MAKQLYKVLKNVPIPNIDYFDGLTGEIIGTRTDNTKFKFLQPSGYPFLPVEIYLNLELIKIVEGTVKNKAGCITHLVRLLHETNRKMVHTGKKTLQIEGLTTIKIEGYSKELLHGYAADGYKLRNKNTVITILKVWVAFLEWYQGYFLFQDNFIGIDTEAKTNRIKLVEKIYKDKRGVTHTYKSFDIKLLPETTPSKPSMSQQTIKLLWDAHETLKNEQTKKVSKQLKWLFTETQHKEHFDFITARRDIILRLLEALGARPCEIIHIPRVKNEKNIQNGKLFIFTAKKGDDRTVSIDQALAMKLEIFLTNHVPKLEIRLKKAGLISKDAVIDDCLLLNATSGKVITSGTFYQLFRDIRIKAGIEGKACARMFRRRFITNMVKLHLSSFLTDNPIKSKYNCNEDDYLSILKKITKLTGHKKPESLLEYIELAWDELDIFSAANEAKVINERLISLKHEMSDFISSVNDLNINKKNKDKILSDINKIKDLTVITESNLYN
jgi:hypothetical protein